MEKLSRHPWGRTLAERIASDLRRSDGHWVRLTAVHTLSKRCHPTGKGQIEKKIQPLARQVSKQLFGFVVAHKLTPEHHRHGPAKASEDPAQALVVLVVLGSLGYLLLSAC